MAGLVFERDVYLAAEPNDNELMPKNRSNTLFLQKHYNIQTFPPTRYSDVQITTQKPNAIPAQRSPR
jgi:hypothetical protein